MNAKIDYDILNRKLKIAIWKDITTNGDAKCIVLKFEEHIVPECGPLAMTSVPKAEGEVILRALATAMQEYGILPESATNAELKAVKEELTWLRTQQQQLLNTVVQKCLQI